MTAENVTTLARPRGDELPEGVELDAPKGRYGGVADVYVRRLLNETRALYPGRPINATIIRKMRRHYQVSACLLVHTLAILRADWTIECDDDEEREWLTSAMELVMFDLKRTAARALWAGYSPNTLTFTANPDLGGIVISEVRDLDPFTCQPLVEPDTYTYAGFVQDEGKPTQVLVDEAESVWFVEGMESGNLYGRPVLDAAVDPWQDHAAFRAFHARYLERFGEPVVKGRAPSGQTVTNALEVAQAAAENPPRDVTPVLEDNLDTIKRVGEELRHHSVVALPGDMQVGPDGKSIGYSWDLDYLEAKRTGGDEFLNALREADKRIARAIFTPDLLFSNTEETGSNALGQSHRTVFTDAADGRLDDFGRQITAQPLRVLRLINFGPGSADAALKFAPLSDEDRDKLWELVAVLVEGNRLPLAVEAIAARLGLELAVPEEDPAEDKAANPFASVGLPALVEALIITTDEARELLEIEGPAPEAPPPPPIVLPVPEGPEGQFARHQYPAVRRALGLDPNRLPAGALAKAPDVGNLPEWQQPQSWNPPPYAREPNARERRVGFAKVESELNRAERRTIDKLDTILERERERVLKRVSKVVRTGTPQEVLAALGSIEVGGGPVAARAWAELMRDVYAVGLDSLRAELAAYAASIPSTIGPVGEAMVKAYAQSASERVFAALTTDVRLALLNAYTSSVSRAGLAAQVSAIFDAYESSEGKGPRLTTRNLSSKALNVSRRDGIERSGVPLRGAQYSALLDRRTCDLCRDLDELVIPIEHTDYARFTPPVHHNCRCMWVYITTDEADFTPTWSTPATSKVDRFGGLVI